MNDEKSANTVPVGSREVEDLTNCRKNMQSSHKISQLTKFFLVIALFSVVSHGWAANWFVRPAQTGSNNGTDWNNAWSISGINWASVSPGDTIWLAGGTYGGSLNPQKSGVAGNLIYVKRVQATDAAATSAAGWNAAFDSQVIVAPAGAKGCYWNAQNVGSYLFIDGRVDSGISFRMDNNVGGYDYHAPVHFGIGSGGQQFVTLTNIDMAGPQPSSSAYFHNTYNCAFSIYPGNGNGGFNSPVHDILVTHCRLHGAADVLFLIAADTITIENSKLYDNSSSNPSFHANLCEYWGSNLIFRRNEVYSWEVEGFMLFSGSGPISIYGNVFRDPMNSVARIIEISSAYTAGGGPVIFNNNTCVNIPLAVFSSASRTNYKQPSQVRNNIYWASSVNIGASPDPAPDYDYSNVSLGEVHGVNGVGQSPFVNLAGKDFHLTPSVSSALPRDKGVALPAPYNVDMDGHIRGADGGWDIGAYEYGTGGGSTNPVILVNPTSVSFGSVAGSTTKTITNAFSVQNVGGGTLAGTATVPLPFRIVSGGTYSLGNNQSQTVSVSYTPSAASSDNQTVTFAGGGGTTASVSGQLLAISTGLTFESYAGDVTAPFVTNAGGYISQATETGVADGGRASYGFQITNAGSYVVSANVNAPNEAANSMFVNMDAEPSDPTMIWDIPVTAGTGLVNRTVSWRGTGSDTNNQYIPAVFNLGTGVHQLIIRGREANVKLGTITIAPYLSRPSLGPPQNLHVVAGP